MGNKQTLINFLNWVNERYEAEKVILQFSNHGGGPRSAPIYAKTEDGFSIKIDNSGRRALCWDESSSLTGGSFLKTSDVSDALAAAGYGEDNKLDMILMDVCLGASVEDSYQFKDYANYLVASPNTVPGMGMDYVSMMESFKSGSTIKSIGEQLIKDYRAYYEWDFSTWQEVASSLGSGITVDDAVWYSPCGISTLSMIDLTKIDELEDKITALATFLLSSDKVLDGIFYDENNEVVYEETATTRPMPYLDLLKDYVRFSGMTGNSMYYLGSYSWLYDIGFMIDNFMYIADETILDNSGNPVTNVFAWPDLVTACSDVKTALKGAIVKAWRDFPYSTGNLYEVLGGSHYGLVISGETIAVDGSNIVPGSCPDFYETDLAFGKDSAWTELLVEWFGN